MTISNALPTCAFADQRPNIIFILADDLGWSDTTLFGTTQFYRTPHIKRLAARGMTFNRAYSSSPLCSPTRASILTGLSPARIGITAPNCHLPQVALNASTSTNASPKQQATAPNSATRFDPKYYTLAEALKDNNYATGHFGKWHLGSEPYSPLQHGFDVDIPHWHGPGPAGSFVAPWKYPDFDPKTPNEHIEDRMADEAVAFIEEHKDEPFFLNYWMFSVHAPFDAKRHLVEAYRKKVDPNDPQRSPTYAAMIESMDDAVGTLIDTLDRLGIADNTIIIFASDNGGNMYNEVDGTTPTNNSPLRGGKATIYEGGIRGPAIVVHPNSVEAGSKSDAIIQSSDFYPTLLEMLTIERRPNQQFDGISIAPALDGKPLNRQAIFTYFPHSPKIPDWLPPAVSVHSCDWKLIRIFHGGQEGKHRYKLFNLSRDVGEKNNLVEQHPDRVKELDALIEQFLVDTDAVRPLPNPGFDPSRYRQKLEGIADLKGGASKPKGTRSAQTVAGWQPGGTCELSRSGDTLVVNSYGKDPYFSSLVPNKAAVKSVVLIFTMESDSSGTGQIFWKDKDHQPFSADRSKRFEVKHDGRPQQYRIEWNVAHPVTAVRIDPSKGSGQMTISQIKLLTDDGRVLHEW